MLSFKILPNDGGFPTVCTATHYEWRSLHIYEDKSGHDLAVGIQLLLSPLRRRQHLLEEAEPVSTTDSKAQKMTKAKSKSDEKVGAASSSSSSSSELEPKHKIPSSLVTLTELEKRQLEDVLMRIGLKDCGL